MNEIGFIASIYLVLAIATTLFLYNALAHLYYGGVHAIQLRMQSEMSTVVCMEVAILTARMEVPTGSYRKLLEEARYAWKRDASNSR